LCGIVNILQSAVLVCKLLTVGSLNSSTLHVGTGSLFKQICVCKCQPGYSVTDCWVFLRWSVQWSSI